MGHIHNWKIIAKTYSSPNYYGTFSTIDSDDSKLMAKILMGYTTIIWECQDKECRQIRREEMLGKEY